MVGTWEAMVDTILVMVVVTMMEAMVMVVDMTTVMATVEVTVMAVEVMVEDIKVEDIRAEEVMVAVMVSVTVGDTTNSSLKRLLTKDPSSDLTISFQRARVSSPNLASSAMIP